LVAAAKFLVAATKILFVVPNFVAVPKPFFSVYPEWKLESGLIRPISGHQPIDIDWPNVSRSLRISNLAKRRLYSAVRKKCGRGH